MTPTIGSIEIEFAGTALELLPDRAVWWRERQTLLVADVHLGKGATFRALGVPIPAGSTARDLSRLTSLIDRTRPRRMVILGDLLHARVGRQPEVLDAIATWRDLHRDVRITLVRGNHDRSSGYLPPEWRIEEVEEPFEDSGVVFTHDPPCDAALPTFAGHLHPMAALQDFDGSYVNVPCYVFDERCAILPSFGTFTGGRAIRPNPPRRRLFLCTPTRVVALSTPANQGV